MNFLQEHSNLFLDDTSCLYFFLKDDSICPFLFQPKVPLLNYFDFIHQFHKFPDT